MGKRLLIARMALFQVGAGAVSILVLGVLMAAGAIFWLFLSGSSGDQNIGEAVPMIIMAIMIFLGLLLVIVKRRAG